MHWRATIETRFVTKDSQASRIDMDLRAETFKALVRIIQQQIHWLHEFPWFVTPHPASPNSSLEEWAAAFRQPMDEPGVELDVTVWDTCLELTVHQK